MKGIKDNNTIRSYVRSMKEDEITREIDTLISDLSSQSLYVEFGTIGKKTTYAMIYNEDHSIEYVGYTFVSNLKYYNPNTGKLKSLQQALARKESLSSRSS